MKFKLITFIVIVIITMAVSDTIKAQDTIPSSIDQIFFLWQKYEHQGLQCEEQNNILSALGYYFKGLFLNPHFIEYRFAQSLNFSKDQYYSFFKHDLVRRQNILHFIEDFSDSHKNLTGKHICVYAEKGLGDSLLFCRYISTLLEYGVHVTLAAPEPLHQILESLPWKCSLITPQQMHTQSFDYYLPLLALPYLHSTLLNKDSNMIITNNSYLKPSAASIEYIKENILFSPSKLNIGIVWQGNSSHIYDAYRSIPLSNFYGIAKKYSNIQLYSLQTHEGTDQLESAPSDITIIDLKSYLSNFDRAAACITEMDLIITIDSAIAHLSGALGKKTFLLIPTVPDFRWFYQSDSSIWYPNVKLIRKKADQSWKETFEQINLYD